MYSKPSWARNGKDLINISHRGPSNCPKTTLTNIPKLPLNDILLMTRVLKEYNKQMLLHHSTKQENETKFFDPNRVQPRIQVVLGGDFVQIKHNKKYCTIFKPNFLISYSLRHMNIQFDSKFSEARALTSWSSI